MFFHNTQTPGLEIIMIDLAQIPLIAAGLLIAMSFVFFVFYYLFRNLFVIHWRHYHPTDINHPHLYQHDLRRMRTTLVVSISNSSLLLFFIVLHFCGLWEVPMPGLWGITALVLLIIAFRTLRNHDRMYTPKL